MDGWIKGWTDTPSVITPGGVKNRDPSGPNKRVHTMAEEGVKVGGMFRTSRSEVEIRYKRRCSVCASISIYIYRLVFFFKMLTDKKRNVKNGRREWSGRAGDRGSLFVLWRLGEEAEPVSTDGG